MSPDTYIGRDLRSCHVHVAAAEGTCHRQVTVRVRTYSPMSTFVHASTYIKPMQWTLCKEAGKSDTVQHGRVSYIVSHLLYSARYCCSAESSAFCNCLLLQVEHRYWYILCKSSFAPVKSRPHFAACIPEQLQGRCCLCQKRR